MFFLFATNELVQSEQHPSHGIYYMEHLEPHLEKCDKHTTLFTDLDHTAFFYISYIHNGEEKFNVYTTDKTREIFEILWRKGVKIVGVTSRRPCDAEHTRQNLCDVELLQFFYQGDSWESEGYAYKHGIVFCGWEGEYQTKCKATGIHKFFDLTPQPESKQLLFMDDRELHIKAVQHYLEQEHKEKETLTLHFNGFTMLEYANMNAKQCLMEPCTSPIATFNFMFQYLMHTVRHTEAATLLASFKEKVEADERRHQALLELESASTQGACEDQLPDTQEGQNQEPVTTLTRAEALSGIDTAIWGDG